MGAVPCVFSGPRTGPAFCVSFGGRGSGQRIRRRPNCQQRRAASRPRRSGKVAVPLHAVGDIDESVGTTVATPARTGRFRVDSPTPVTGQKSQSSHDRSSVPAAQNTAAWTLVGRVAVTEECPRAVGTHLTEAGLCTPRPQRRQGQRSHDGASHVFSVTPPVARDQAPHGPAAMSDR